MQQSKVGTHTQGRSLTIDEYVIDDIDTDDEDFDDTEDLAEDDIDPITQEEIDILEDILRDEIGLEDEEVDAALVGLSLGDHIYLSLRADLEKLIEQPLEIIIGNQVTTNNNKSKRQVKEEEDSNRTIKSLPLKQAQSEQLRIPEHTKYVTLHWKKKKAWEESLRRGTGQEN